MIPSCAHATPLETTCLLCMKTLRGNQRKPWVEYPPTSRDATNEFLKALTCLYIAVEKDVADDVNRKAILALDEAFKEGRAAQAAEITRLREAQFSAEDLEELKFWLEVVDEAGADRRATRDEDLQAGYFPPAMSAESDARFKEVHDNLPYYIRKAAALAGGIAPPSAWISVSERLPEQRGFYVVSPGEFGNDWMRAYLSTEKEWIGPRDVRVNVTHWMPLAAPPSPPEAR